MLKVEETVALWPMESMGAGAPVTFQDHFVPMQSQHINLFNKQCGIVCALDRVTPPWEGRSKHFTQKF